MNRALMLSLLLLVPSLGAAAEETSPSAKSSTDASGVPDAAASAPAAPAASGVQAWVDPETGKLTDTPTTDQRSRFEILWRQHQEQQARERKSPKAFALPGGGTGVFFDGGFLSSYVVRVDEDGNLHASCREHEHAEDLPETPAAGAPLR